MFSLSLLGMGIGLGANINTSGEINVFKNILKKFDKNKTIVLFDIGANIGNYSKVLSEKLGEGNYKYIIHAFEPSISAFEKLSKNDNPFIIKNNLGISDTKTTGILYSDKQISGLASLHNRQLAHFNINLANKEEIKLTTLDEYCRDNNIEFIDFLKIDIEGHEYKAFLGAKHLIENKKIRVIQLEFGGANIDSRTYFQDFWYLFNTNYYMYRILADGIRKINAYNEKLEQFSCSNYLLILKE